MEVPDDTIGTKLLLSRAVAIKSSHSSEANSEK